MFDDLGGSAQSDIGWASIGRSISGIGASMDAFAGAAASGVVEINEAGGKALLDAIKKMRDWVDGQVLDLRQLGQQLPLGGSNGAQVMKPYLQQVATDGQGFLTQLTQFNESLAKAEEGINTAMAKYQETEAANSAAFRKVEPT